MISYINICLSLSEVLHLVISRSIHAAQMALFHSFFFFFFGWVVVTSWGLILCFLESITVSCLLYCHPKLFVVRFLDDPCHYDIWSGPRSGSSSCSTPLVTSFVWLTGLGTGFHSSLLVAPSQSVLWLLWPLLRPLARGFFFIFFLCVH